MTGRPLIKCISKQTALAIIEHRNPLGNYIAVDGNKYIAIDNTIGEAYTEEFEQLSTAYLFLANPFIKLEKLSEIDGWKRERLLKVYPRTLSFAKESQ